MKNIENIKVIKKFLHRKDYALIIERIRREYHTEFARSTVASALSPSSPFHNELIYTVALQLALERKKALEGIAQLEKELTE